jgi:hypothetical protein
MEQGVLVDVLHTNPSKSLISCQGSVREPWGVLCVPIFASNSLRTSLGVLALQPPLSRSTRKR